MEPCSYCGVRPDVLCKHRAPVDMPPPPEYKVDRRTMRDYTGNGRNFRAKRAQA